MVALYRQAKAGRIEPALVGRLAHLLNSLAAINRDVDLEARLARLEEAAAVEAWPGPAANGHERHAPD